MFEYAVLTTLYWAALYGLYALVLRRNTFFQLNRCYLLGALAAGMVLPLFQDWISWLRPEAEPVLYVAPLVEGFEALHAFEITVTAPAEQAAFPWKAVIGMLYLSGVAFGLIRFGTGLYKLWKLSREGERSSIMGCKVFFTRQAHLPFSFGRTIYLSRRVQYAAEEEADILQHERAHIQGGHTMDVLALELLGIVFWFSPPLYLYRRSLRLLHEYIADAAVLRTRSTSAYGRLLIRQALPGRQPAIGHSFHSSLKQRIAMMTKAQSKPGARWLYLAAVPLAFGLVILFSQRSAIAASLPELSTLLTFAGNEEKSLVAEALSETMLIPVIAEKDPNAAPVFPGCENEPAEARKACSEKKFLQLVSQRLRYPEEARRAGIMGTVTAQYTVDAKGAMTDLAIIEDIGGGCGEEVMRVLRHLAAISRWTPGMKEGKPVATTFTLPVQFSKLEVGGEIAHDNSVEVNPGRKEIKTSFKGVATVIAWEAPGDEDVFFFDNRLVSAEEFQRLKQSGKAFDLVEVFPGANSGGTTGNGAGGKTYLVITKPEGAAPTFVAHDPNEEIFKVVEEMPRFPGCEDTSTQIVEKKNCADHKMLEFIYNSIRYPATAREAGIEGTVVISFIIEQDGKISEPKIVRDIGGGCADEALRVVNLMPDWIPGRQKGEVVRVQFNLPVRFKLDAPPPAPVAPAGSQALKVEDFKLFPNPSGGKFTLQFNAPEKPTLIQVHDAQGRVVLTRNLSTFSGTFREELDLGKSPKGDYAVVISQGEAVFTAGFMRL